MHMKKCVEGIKEAVSQYEEGLLYKVEFLAKVYDLTFEMIVQVRKEARKDLEILENLVMPE